MFAVWAVIRAEGGRYAHVVVAAALVLAVAGCGSPRSVDSDDVRPALKRLDGLSFAFADVGVPRDADDVIAGRVTDRGGNSMYFAVLVGRGESRPGFERVLPELNGAFMIGDGNVLMLFARSDASEVSDAEGEMEVAIETAVFDLALGLRGHV